MADENTPAGTGAPAAPVTPPAAAPAAPAAPDTQSPAWLPERLAQAKHQGEQAALAALGIQGSDVAKAKAILDEAAKTAEANKSAEQRAADLAAKLTTTQTEAEQRLGIIKEHAARMLGVLEPDHQKAVRDIAGDDPAKQLQTIQALTPIWAKQQPAAPAVPVPPATTAPPPNAPGGAPGTSPPDPVATYGQLKASNPFAAAAYGARNPSVYQPPKG